MRRLQAVQTAPLLCQNMISNTTERQAPTASSQCLLTFSPICRHAGGRTRPAGAAAAAPAGHIQGGGVRSAQAAVQPAAKCWRTVHSRSGALLAQQLAGVGLRPPSRRHTAAAMNSVLADHPAALLPKVCSIASPPVYPSLCLASVSPFLVAANLLCFPLSWHCRLLPPCIAPLLTRLLLAALRSVELYAASSQACALTCLPSLANAYSQLTFTSRRYQPPGTRFQSLGPSCSEPISLCLRLFCHKRMKYCVCRTARRRHCAAPTAARASRAARQSGSQWTKCGFQ